MQLCYRGVASSEKQIPSGLKAPAFFGVDTYAGLDVSTELVKPSFSSRLCRPRHRSFPQLRLDFHVPTCNAHPSRPRLSSGLDDGHIMPAACEVDIRGGGANVSSIHLDVRAGGSGADMCVYVGRRSRRP